MHHIVRDCLYDVHQQEHMYGQPCLYRRAHITDMDTLLELPEDSFAYQPGSRNIGLLMRTIQIVTGWEIPSRSLMRITGRKGVRQKDSTTQILLLQRRC